MVELDVFKDLAEQTGGDVYLGVVGPVRTGKSTFIKRFMELVVIPRILHPEDRERAIDELPQSAGGRQIMTTEPKFIPNQAIEIEVADGLRVSVRLVDCVGYPIPDARGYEDENGPRLVHTPWFEDPIPFEEAAEIGTRKVIQDHSTIGIVVTTDGTIGELPRAAYEEAEARVIEELKAVGKPFIVILNSTRPQAPETEALRTALVERYDVPVLALSALTMGESDVLGVLREALYEFPVHEVKVNLPSWVMVLDADHWLRKAFEQAVAETVEAVERLRDVERIVGRFEDYPFVAGARLAEMHLGQGIAEVDLDAAEGLFEQVVHEVVGREIRGKDELLEMLIEFAHAKREYDHFASAIEMVRATGYGVAPPRMEEMELAEPEIIRQGARFGVSLKAKAPSIHLIKVDVEAEFSPIIGTEKQSEELATFLMQDFEKDPRSIWQTELFGRSLYAIVNEGIQAKLHMMPEQARHKLRETLTRIINEGSGGLIAILL
ncbi:stage IV sporulation protein A [Hydrogenibacillus schlegelii]|uniref:Stage IV sporulation protein A n=1 Tax=Hydrogenibacillus schlegelii TaxID=1484 RepID=A0A132NC72_HYDSH|nr:stage IV sporulation protein A [Hydrogenibacillus schlegelii]KWX07708.1 stage IV sporulation protein A [Hydrogenibacillus schlegelii]OAR05534.1 stage IV sporulation protein A [Hydrogenibacillus schlegelii]